MGAQVGSCLCSSCLRECIRQRAHCDLRAHCVTTCSGPSHQTNVHHPVCHWSAAWEHEVQGEASIVLIRNYPQPACWRGAWSVLWLLPAVQVTESATILSQRAGEEPWSVLWLCQPSRLRNIMHWGRFHVADSQEPSCFLTCVFPRVASQPSQGTGEPRLRAG